MLKFPNKSEFNLKIAKEKFYSYGKISKKDKEIFVNDVEKVVWKNKLSEQTANIAPGENVDEIEVIYIELRNKYFDIKLLQLIKNIIPYRIIFLIKYEDEACLAVHYSGKLFRTEWQTLDSLNLSLNGLNFDKVWENVVIQIGKINLERGNSIDEQIAEDERKAKLLKEIERLEKSARKEKQPRRKFDLHQEIQLLKKELEKFNTTEK